MMESTNNAPERKGVPLWAQVIIWVFLAGLLVIVALGLNRAQQGTIQPGHVVEDFALPLFSGYEFEGRNEVHLDELRGRVVVINFWASWCKPCEQEAADLQRAWEQYGSTGEVIFLGVDYVDTEPDARVYLKKFGITYPNGPDLATRISQYFRTKGVPETYFIDRDGVLRYVQVGPFSSLQQIQGILDPILVE
jgi:cytochrome c biogenesis protein CcmG, thiol:disulfide interchange protein DsbE